MKEKQEQNTSIGLVVHTNLVAGASCINNNGATAKCLEEYLARGRTAASWAEYLKCDNSC